MDKNFENIKPDLTVMGGYGIFGKKAVLLGFSKIGIIVTFYDSQEVKEITRKLAQESKERGEGTFARIASSMQAGNVYIANASSKTIQQTLDANKENFFIQSDDIEKIKINKSTDSENAQDYYSIVIKTSKEKYKFNLQIDGAKERMIKIYCKENYSIKI